jgi:hypothetical protein
MESNSVAEVPSFFARLRTALQVLTDAAFARDVQQGLQALRAAERKQAPKPGLSPQRAPERENASGLFLLSAMQREGRLIDFLQQEVAAFSDEEVGAAARVVHAGCSRVLKQYFHFQPALGGDEGSSMTVPPGFDAQRIRLAGNVSGQPPFKGTLKHHGWIAAEIRLPAVPESLDPRVVAPAEVELA